MSAGEPDRDCPLCPRLVAYRRELRARQPDWHNAPVHNFGTADARLLIIGLAPGAKGANRTGRPFTGDDAGKLLFATLERFGFSSGAYHARPDDGVELLDCLITNVLRCVPPQNRPLATEVATCRRFLTATLFRLPLLRCVVALGRIAHDDVLRALALKPRAFPFAHGREHLVVAEAFGRSVTLIDSYHCSRLNTSTGALTTKMFDAVFARARAVLDEDRKTSE